MIKNAIHAPLAEFSHAGTTGGKKTLPRLVYQGCLKTRGKYGENG
jgi:hypothetical protein